MKQKIILKMRWIKKFIRGYGVLCLIRYLLYAVLHVKKDDYYWLRKKHEKRQKVEFQIRPTFSILIPLYTKEQKKVEKLIQSIQQQTYKKWEICLSYGDEFRKAEKSFLSKNIKKDRRIKVITSPSPLSSTENINQALKAARGEYIALVEIDGLLDNNAFYECVKIINQYPKLDILYTDEDRFCADRKQFFHPHFKSDYNLDLLRSMNYIGYLFLVKKEIQEEAGVFREELYYEYEYDFILRCVEKSENIYHIPKVLYHKRVKKKNGEGTAIATVMKERIADEKARVVRMHLERCNIKGSVCTQDDLGICKVNYPLEKELFISIIIPNRDHVDDLERCIKSLYEVSGYSNFEVIIVENGSNEKKIFMYYKSLKERHNNINIVNWNKSKEFNYSALNNFGVSHAKGEYLLFLNNDTEFIGKGCMLEMVSHAVRKEVGAVGARLYYPDGTIQHAGVILGLGGIAGHAFSGESHNAKGYFSRIQCTQDLSAVTAACMMVSRNLFEEVGGFDEKLKVAFNDIDLCMKIRMKGRLIVYTPYAELYHYESKSRGIEDTKEKIERFHGEVHYFEKKWKDELEKGDPYYNPNLTLEKNNFSLRIV